MKTILKSIWILLCLPTNLIFAQDSHITPPSFVIRTAPNELAPDSVAVAFYKGIVHGNPPYRIIVDVQKRADGSFAFTIPTEQAISPFGMSIYYPDKRKIQTANIYYAEPSDQIEISLRRNPDTIFRRGNGKIQPLLKFSGFGAEKYKVCDLMWQIHDDVLKQLRDNSTREFWEKKVSKSDFKIKPIDYYNSNEFKKYFEILLENIKQSIKRQTDTLSTYEKKIGKNITTFYSYELSSYYLFRHFIMSLNYTLSNLGNQSIAETAKPIYTNIYFSNIDSLKPKPKDNWFKYGIYFRANASQDIMEELNLQSHTKGFPFDVQYNAIKKLKNRELRDILLTKLFVERYFVQYINNSETRDSCLKDALKLIKNPELLTALNYEFRLKSGSKLYDFSFVDTIGNEVGLKDLRGKVFILDFYFNGCAGCSAFAKRFEREIYPEFANNPNFKVLSVSIDKRDQWLKAIRSGLYTHPASLNLNTKTGFNHPLFKHYDINGFPWVLLIDGQSRVISFAVAETNSEQISIMIKNALSNLNTLEL